MASDNALNHVPVRRDARWVSSDVGVDDDNRKGTLDDVQAYCGPGPGVYTDEDMEVDEQDKSAGDGTSTRSMDSAFVALPMNRITNHSVYRASGPRRGSPVSRWGSDVWTRVIVASALALSLQWGTTGAAFMIVVSVVIKCYPSRLLTSHHSGSLRPKALVGIRFPESNYTRPNHIHRRLSQRCLPHLRPNLHPRLAHHAPLLHLRPLLPPPTLTPQLATPPPPRSSRRNRRLPLCRPAPARQVRREPERGVDRGDLFVPVQQFF